MRRADSTVSERFSDRDAIAMRSPRDGHIALRTGSAGPAGGGQAGMTIDSSSAAGAARNASVASLAGRRSVAASAAATY